MNLVEVKKKLDALFDAQPKHGAVRHIIFWYDDYGVFAQEVDSLELENAKTLKVSDNNQFAVKLYIERKDTQSNLLVYSPAPRPADKENWLTDTIKYSEVFSTDEASLILLNYKLDPSMRQVAEDNKAFFRANERVRRFDRYGLTDWSETKFDVAVLSALCKLNVPNLDGCVRIILAGVTDGNDAVLKDISKFGSMSRLWKLIRRNYGYHFEEDSFEKLAILLLVTHFAHSFAHTLPKAWENYSAHNTNCFVFVDNFMKDTSCEDSFGAICTFVADKLNLPEHLEKWDVTEIIECDTFPQLDRAILSRIRGNILAGAGEYSEYKKLINQRCNRRWFGHFKSEYNVLDYACEFLLLFQKNRNFSAPSAKALWTKYRDDYYKFDYFYRKFSLAFDSLRSPDDYRKLAEKVEAAYTNGVLSDLSVKWCELLDGDKDENGYILWQVEGVTPQARFYERYVRPFISKDERVVVIISDAFRYETATEFISKLAREHKGESSLDVMLGVIPSYTALGMAALLPRKTLEITDKGDIMVDGINSSSTENKDRILKSVKRESVAIQADDLRPLSKAAMAEKFSGVKLIYIYHNVIDWRGEHSTEREAFEATEKAFDDLSAIVRKLRNDISAINILLTADHGYISRRTALQVSDKTSKDTENSITAKRRFILTKHPAELQGTQKFSMRYLGQVNITAIAPRGANIFPIQGKGANFVHGGALLQEVMIPVIKFKSGKNNTKATAAQKVTLSLSSLSRKITSVVTHLDFFQNEPVGEKLMPLRVKAFFEDSDGNRISNENIIIAESASREPAGRAYREKFTLRNIKYDKKQTYYLVLQEDDEMVEHEIERFTYTIDLVFGGIQF